MVPDPVSKKCELILKRGPICENGIEQFKGQRSFALCRAFELLELGQATSFGDGLKKAWDEIHTTCILSIPLAKK